MAEIIAFGKVAGVHGIKGTIKVYTEIGLEDNVLREQNISLKDKQGNVSDYVIESHYTKREHTFFKLKEVNNRSLAEELLGSQLLIRRSQLPALDDETYYWSDLIGLPVYQIPDEYIGYLTDIIETGSNDVYVVVDENATGSSELLIPALKSVVRNIDLQNKRILVDLPDGLR